MVSSYTIEQFPKNKDFNPESLSKDQKKIRSYQKKYVYGETIVCRTCCKELPTKEFYIKIKSTGRRATQCRDCQMKTSGVIEIGRGRFAKKILKKGFRRCSICKDIKPLTDFKKNRTSSAGYSHNCYKCQRNLTAKFVQKQRDEIGDYHIRQYAKRRGVDFEIAKTELIKKREPKYVIDGKDFFTLEQFAKYIEIAYGHPITTTTKRIATGKTVEQCKMSEFEMRSIAQKANWTKRNNQ